MTATGHVAGFMSASGGAHALVFAMVMFAPFMPAVIRELLTEMYGTCGTSFAPWTVLVMRKELP
jgi:hypothetical protein